MGASKGPQAPGYARQRPGKAVALLGFRLSVQGCVFDKLTALMAVQESVLVLQERLANEQKLVQLIDRIHAAKTLDSIFLELQGEILAFLDAERMTLYAVDGDKKELYSKFLALDAMKEIR